MSPPMDAGGPYPLGAPMDPAAAGGYPPPQPSRGKGALVGLIIVSVVAALLLGVSGLMTYLWVGTSNEFDAREQELTAEVAGLESTVASQNSTIAGLEGEREELTDRIDELMQNLAGSEGEIEFLNEAFVALDACIEAIEVYDAMAFLGASREELDEFWITEAGPLCDEARKYR